MRKATIRFVLVSFLSLGLAGPGLAAEKKSSLKYWYGQGKHWVLPVVGPGGLYVFGNAVAQIASKIWRGKDDKEGCSCPGCCVTLGLSVVGLLLSTWCCLDGVEKISDVVSGLNSSQTTKKKANELVKKSSLKHWCGRSKDCVLSAVCLAGFSFSSIGIVKFLKNWKKLENNKWASLGICVVALPLSAWCCCRKISYVVSGFNASQKTKKKIQESLKSALQNKK